MEDAHTTLLKLDPSNGNTFFAVFDGHGGVYTLIPIPYETNTAEGSSVAKYAGQHVAERLATDPAYSEGDYKAALKRAFLGTDEDLRAGESRRLHLNLC
jgi:protein phosphatase 2C family protein 2/3